MGRRVEKERIIRYHSVIKENALGFAKELNKKEVAVDGKIKKWRVAVKIDNRIIFDVDNEDINNIYTIVNYYSALFGELRVFKTYSGYHIFSKRVYDNRLDFQYDTCRVLYPLLETQHLQKYVEAVSRWYKKKLKDEFNQGLTREQFLDELQTSFPDSGLYCGIGNFDILFALNVILKRYYCLRISKKADNDKPVEIFLEKEEL